MGREKLTRKGLEGKVDMGGKKVRGEGSEIDLESTEADSAIT